MIRFTFGSEEIIVGPFVASCNTELGCGVFEDI